MGSTNLKLNLKSASSSNFAQNEEKFLTLKFYSFVWEKLLGIGQLHTDRKNVNDFLYLVQGVL